MLVTLLGIVTLVRPEQPSNAEPPMLVTLLGIVELLQPTRRVFVDVSIIALQFSLLSYIALVEAIVMLVRLKQPLNAELSILVTLLPIVTDVKVDLL